MRYRSLCAVVFLCITALSLRAQEDNGRENNEISTLQREREVAEDLLAQGQLTDAANVLLASLKAAPPDQDELIDTGYRSIQLLLFTMEYLMDDNVLTAFSANSLNTGENEVDKFISCAFNIYIGQESDGKTIATQDLMYELTPIFRQSRAKIKM